jgi:hypothetical protein
MFQVIKAHFHKPGQEDISDEEHGERRHLSGKGDEV